MHLSASVRRRSGPPSQAVAAGYTTLVGGAEFDASTDVSATTNGTVTAPFYLYDASGSGVVTGYTIANSILTISTNANPFGGGVMSLCHNTLAVKSTPGALLSNAGRGVAYQYGYFECRAKFDPFSTGSWWPTFWLSGSLLFSQSQYLELDIMEVAYVTPPAPWTLNGTVYSSLHSWGDPAYTNGPTGPTGSLSPSQGSLVVSAGAFNKYGMLWSPSQLIFYYNDVPGLTITMNASTPWSYSAGDSGPATVVPNTACLIPPMYLGIYLGTGATGQSAQYDWVRVWSHA